jgi:hypothetical protein
VFALLVPSCCDKSGTSCYHLVTRLMTVTDLLQVVPTRLIQAVRNKLLRARRHQLVTCRRCQTCWNNLLRVCWPHLPRYKMITTCSRLVNNWEQAVRTHLVDKLGYVSISAVPVTLTETHHVNQVSNLRLVYILYLQLSGSFVFLPIFFTLHKITLTVNFLQNCHCEQS